MDKTLIAGVVMAVILVPILSGTFILTQTSFIPFSSEGKGEQEQYHEMTNENLFSQPSNTPTPPQLSERSLAAAAYLVANSNEDDLRSIYDQYGIEDPIQAITQIATKLDNSPEKLAYIEAMIERHKKGNAVTNNYARTDSSTECHNQWTEYNTCLSEYSAEQAEYQSCLAGSFSGSCVKPLSLNLCLKPLCQR